jgi:hypothetical protein
VIAGLNVAPFPPTGRNLPQPAKVLTGVEFW